MAAAVPPWRGWRVAACCLGVAYLVWWLCSLLDRGLVCSSLPAPWHQPYHRCHVASRASATTAEPGHGGRLYAGYLLGAGATTCSWAACAIVSLATYKPHRITHNSIGVLQAFTVLPLIWSVFVSLAFAARRGRSLLHQPEIRKLNFGLAIASLWSAVTIWWAPLFTAALVRTSDPVFYPLALRLVATATHLSVAAVCWCVWWRCSGLPGERIPVRRFVGDTLNALWELLPRAPGPTSSSHEYASLALAFACFTAFAIFAPFPLATVPSLLGKRLARAFGAWTLLATVTCVVLQRHAEGCGLPSKVARTLKRGVRIMAVGHLLIAVARPLLESTDVYPAAMACQPIVLSSWLVYAMSLAIP